MGREKKKEEAIKGKGGKVIREGTPGDAQNHGVQGREKQKENAGQKGVAFRRKGRAAWVHLKVVFMGTEKELFENLKRGTSDTGKVSTRSNAVSCLPG